MSWLSNVIGRRPPPASEWSERFGLSDVQEICQRIAADNQAPDAQEYAEHYATDTVVGMYRTMAENIFQQIPNEGARVGLDYGCHYGVSTFMYQGRTQDMVWGCDVFPDKVATAERWRQSLHPERRLKFVVSRPDSVPLHANSVDWIVLNAVLYCVHPDFWGATFRELARLLKPGGWLIACDSNNPHCPAALERLRALYWQVEIGDGTLAEPNGALLGRRKSMIAELAPNLEASTVHEVACNTCYLYGEGLRSAVSEFLLSGKRPASPFDPAGSRSPCHPDSGFCEGNITDPFVVQRSLQDVGIETTLCPGPCLVPPDNDQFGSFLESSQGFYLMGTKSSFSSRDGVSD